MIGRDETYISGRDGRGIRMQVTPDGDCREAVFSAKGAGLQVPSLSAVQVEYEREENVWTPLFYGEVRQGGNPRNVTGEDYVLRGLAQRLREVVAPPGFTAPQQPAHLTIRALIQRVIEGGAVGRDITWWDYGYIPAPGEVSPTGVSGGSPLIEYDETLCPDLGFDARAIRDVSGYYVSQLLELIAQDGAGMGVHVVWGVRPDRKFFCKPARTDVAEFVSTDLVREEWKAPIAEAPCTMVQWFIGKRPDGRPITHLSRSGKAFALGERVKPIPLDPSAVAWVAVPSNYTTTGASVTGTYTPLIDGKLYRDGAPFANTYFFGSGEVVISLIPTGPYGRVILDGYSYGADVALYVGGQSIPLGPITLGERVFLSDGSGPITLTLTSPDPSKSVNLALFEFRAEQIDRAALDRAAEYHYSFPAAEPADIEIAPFRPHVDLCGRFKVGAYERAVECWEYRLTEARGLKLGVLIGQADDPFKLAQAAIIKKQTQNGVITAVNAI